MAVPEIHLRQIARWCEQRVPEHALDQVRVEYKVRGSAVTIIERRVPWREDFGPEWTSRPIAQLRYANGRWRLYWPDRNARWHVVDDIATAANPAELLTAADEPHRAFFG